MVKDQRTLEQTGDVRAVMDGEIDRFILAYLKCGGKFDRIDKGDDL
jgi:peptide chain release factor 2